MKKRKKKCCKNCGKQLGHTYFLGLFQRKSFSKYCSEECAWIAKEQTRIKEKSK
jgi:hypothetical protein